MPNSITYTSAYPESDVCHVVTTLDANYIQHCGVMLNSLFSNNQKHTFVIWLIVDFTENKEFRRLKDFLKKHKKHSLCVVHTDGSQVGHFKTAHHITTATYYRLLIPDMIDQNLERILYLDADIIIKKNIEALWQFPLLDCIVAAVPEYGFNRHLALGLREGENYFNAGVMLINLIQWRASRTTEQLLQLLKQRHQSLEMLEQDALNIALVNKWQALPAHYNQTSIFHVLDKNSLSQLEWDDVNNSLHNPTVIHYTGSLKPWHYHCQHPLKDEYFRYLKKTPWKNFHLKEDMVWHKTKQVLKMLVNKVIGKKIFKVYA